MISRAAFLRLRHFWQKGFYDRERKETVTGKAPIGGSRGQRSCQRTQGTDAAADTGGCYFRESISAVGTNDFGTTGGFFMRGFQTNTMKFGRSGQSGRFSFFPKGALTHHPPLAGGGIPPVGRDRALSEGVAAPAGAYGQCQTSAEFLSLSTQLALCIPQRLPHFFVRQCVPTAIEKLPPEDFRCYGYRPGDTHFLFAKKKQGRRDGESAWRSIIWKQKLSAVAQDDPLLPLLHI